MSKYIIYLQDHQTQIFDLSSLRCIYNEILIDDTDQLIYKIESSSPENLQNHANNLKSYLAQLQQKLAEILNNHHITLPIPSHYSIRTFSTISKIVPKIKIIPFHHFILSQFPSPLLSTPHSPLPSSPPSILHSSPPSATTFIGFTANESFSFKFTHQSGKITLENYQISQIGYLAIIKKLQLLLQQKQISVSDQRCLAFLEAINWSSDTAKLKQNQLIFKVSVSEIKQFLSVQIDQLKVDLKVSGGCLVGISNLAKMVFQEVEIFSFCQKVSSEVVVRDLPVFTISGNVRVVLGGQSVVVVNEETREFEFQVENRSGLDYLEVWQGGILLQCCQFVQVQEFFEFKITKNYKILVENAMQVEQKQAEMIENHRVFAEKITQTRSNLNQTVELIHKLETIDFSFLYFIINGKIVNFQVSERQIFSLKEGKVIRIFAFGQLHSVWKSTIDQEMSIGVIYSEKRSVRIILSKKLIWTGEKKLVNGIVVVQE